jgi:hypothetical protein
VSPADLLGGAMLAALVLYALLAGADFGGGIWDLLATGPRKKAQRDIVEQAIGPIWEANHVWLILVIVLLFTCFPSAFAAISIALFVPLVLLLFGIVLRGAAFTFRTYDRPEDKVQVRWGLVFSSSSVLAPVVLGVVVGAIASGRLAGPPEGSTRSPGSRRSRCRSGCSRRRSSPSSPRATSPSRRRASCRRTSGAARSSRGWSCSARPCSPGSSPGSTHRSCSRGSRGAASPSRSTRRPPSRR